MFRVGIYHPANAAPGMDARGGGYHETITLKRAARGKRRMFSNLIAARAQMGTSLVFHVIFSVLGVGLPLLLCLAEGFALWRKDGTWLSLSRQWTKAFTILFAIG